MSSFDRLPNAQVQTKNVHNTSKSCSNEKKTENEPIEQPKKRKHDELESNSNDRTNVRSNRSNIDRDLNKHPKNKEQKRVENEETAAMTKRNKSKKSKNKGDIAEVQIKKFLKSETEKESSQLLSSLFKLGPKDTVNFPTQLLEKSKNTEKADCFIEVERDQTKTLYKISIKFQGSNDCSIVNQDHRHKSAYLPNGRNGEEGILFHCLVSLDTLISRLNYERAIGERQQDIDFTDIDFTAVERKAMEDVLVHHSFFGAGTGTFQFGVQANSILIVRNVNDLNSWVLTHCPTLEDKKKYIQSKWDQYIFAIRRKGKQEEKSYDNSQELLDCVLPWFVPRFVNRVEKKGYNYEGAGREYVAKPHHDAKCTLNVRMKKK